MEGVDWNPECACFTCGQWDAKVKEIADVGIFQFEGPVYKSALLPGPFSRILQQLEAVSPWVDKILVYQYQGMMNKPGSAAFCGRAASTRLYTAYVNWLKVASGISRSEGFVSFHPMGRPAEFAVKIFPLTFIRYCASLYPC